MSWMALIPAAISIASSFMNKGDKGKPKQLPAKSPQQLQYLGNILKQLQSGNLGQAQNQGIGILQQYMDPQSDIYKNFEQPYMQQFQQQIVPNIAERFAGMGAMGGGLSSSGFGQALSSAGSNLETTLAAMKSGMQRSSINDVMGQYNQLSGLGLGMDPFAYYQQQQGPSGSASAINQMMPMLMQMMGSMGGSK